MNHHPIVHQASALLGESGPTVPPSPPESTDAPPSAYLDFGGGIRWVSDDFFLRGLTPLGLSRDNFRRWMAALCVPAICTGDSVLYDLHSVQLALRAISRVGEPDFTVPGTIPHQTSRQGLTREWWTSHMKTIVTDLLWGRVSNLKYTPREVADAAAAAVKRLAASGMDYLPAAAQRRYSDRAASEAVRRGIDIEPPSPTIPLEPGLDGICAPSDPEPPYAPAPQRHCLEQPPHYDVH